MRNAILMLLLAVTSGSAAAAWVLIGRNEITAAYADPASISRTGNVVRMRDMFDLKTARTLDKKPYLSMTREVEYDCKEERSRLLSFSGHSKSMAAGEVVYSASDPHNWEPISSSSGNATLWKFACETR